MDRLIIGLSTNPSKTAMFSLEERRQQVEAEVAKLADDIQVVTFDGLLVHFAAEQNASMIIRGLRAVSDFEYEYQMAGMNQQLDDEVETVFLMADVALQPIASRLVKEIARFGGCIDKFVTPEIARLVGDRVQKVATADQSS